jgi:ABC-type transporter Mla MlaB component
LREAAQGVHAQGRRRVIRAAEDVTSCEDIRALSLRCAKAIGEGNRWLIIDLESVHKADTKLMACLVSVCQLALSSSARIELRPSPCVMELAKFCRLEWLIDRTVASDQGQPTQGE